MTRRDILAGVPIADPPSTWIEVDTSVLASNVRALARLTGVPVMAVVKANAYGHGLKLVARAVEQAGAAWIGVARPEEGFELRRSGVRLPILVLGLTPSRQLEGAVASDLSLTVWSAEQIEAASQAALRSGRSARLHLKVDTGMGRLGATPERAQALASLAGGRAGVLLEGAYTHFARADEPDAETTRSQERVFRDVLTTLEASGVRPEWIHAANSAAAIAHPSTRFGLVRAGVAVYGLHPSPICQLPSDFRPALAWKSQLSQVKTVPPGRGLSYGHIYTTRSAERIGTIPVGYADGLRRVDGNQVLVGGRRVPVVGRVCMDQILVRLDDVESAAVGDEVVVIGAQGSERITAEEVAERWGTINYEVVCGLSARVPRVEV
ncbi:MAG TPA: alanine racemase [Anaerolineales bacterium]|nr:alanine racemase [Anaerolineales bacterium]